MTRFLTAIALLMVSLPAAAQEGTVAGKTKAEWLAMAKDPSPRKREAAIVAFRIIGAKDNNVLFTLRELLGKDPEERVRLKAVLIVQEMDKQEALRPLLPTLADMLKADKSPAVRAAAAEAIGKGGENAKTVVTALIGAYKDLDVSVRTAAADATGRLGFDVKDAVPGLTELLKDTDTGVRLAAIFALGRIGPDGGAAAPQLADLLTTDKDANVRKESARSLGLLGLDAKAAVPGLAKTLKADAAPEVRQQSAIALAKMGMELKSVAPVLLDVLKTDADKSVRVLTVQALAGGLGAGLKDHLKELTEQMAKDPEGEVRLAIVQEVGNLGPDGKDALPALIKATTDVQITIREAAKVAVKKVKGLEKEKSSS